MTDAKHEIDLPIEIPPVDEGDEFDPNAAWACDVDLSEETEAGAVVLAERDATLPPARVRFTAPVKIRRESAEEILDGVIYNLSPHGAACSAALTLRSGERVWLRFQLNLAEEPKNLLCEVIWFREQDADCFFGLHFLSLTPDEEAAIRRTVAERSDGRAGDWTLPVIPEADPTGRSGPSPILAAAAGMAAGITLALALSVIPNAISGGSAPAEPTQPVAPEPVAARGAAPAEEVVATAESEAEPPRRIDLGPVAEMPPEQAAEPEPRPAPVVAVAPQPKRDLLPRIETPPQQPTGNVLRPLGTDDGLELALLADGLVVDHVSFWLDNPKRLVVDVFGRKSGFERNSYLIEHPLANQLRVGNHPGKVRFVIETTANLASRVSTKPVGSSLVVTLHRG